MITNDEYERLKKLFDMLSSNNDGEVLNAISAISRILNTHALSWSDIILPRKLLPTRVDPNESATGRDTNAGPKPLADASPREMLNALLASPNVSSDTRRDLRDYGQAIAAGRLSPSIRADIQALYNYAIVGGRHV